MKFDFFFGKLKTQRVLGHTFDSDLIFVLRGSEKYLEQEWAGLSSNKATYSYKQL